MTSRTRECAPSQPAMNRAAQDSSRADGETKRGNDPIALFAKIHQFGPPLDRNTASLQAIEQQPFVLVLRKDQHVRETG